jgi:serine protease Do
MIDKVSHPSTKRRAKWLGAAAIAALIAGGAIEGGFVASNPAHAELRSMAQPLAMPSFADVIDQVKPAVVSVRVKVQQVADNDEDGPQFSIPDLPRGNPLEKFFRQFRDEQNQRSQRGERDQPRRFGQAQGSGYFISADGYIVTNNHVVENASDVQIVTEDGRTLEAKVIGTDPKTDVALLKSAATSRSCASPTRRPAWGTGCSRSAIRSASAARSRPASSRLSTATSAPAPMTTSSRSTRR